MTGLFSHRGHNLGASIYQAQRRLERERLLSRFAEALSRHDLAAGDKGGNITRAAKACGLSQQRGSQLFRIICGRLGWQAQ